MASIAPSSSSVAVLRRQPVQFLGGSDVSKQAKGSVSYSFPTNSRNANMKSLGLKIAASLKKNSGFPADGCLENDDTLSLKSTSVRAQDHPTTNSVIPVDSVVAAEIISTDLSCVVDTLSNEEDDAELDLDSPTEGFSSISEAIEDIRQGKDAKEGTTTGVSAKDRAKTVMTLASPYSKPEDFNRPGHIFPLKYRDGGVLKRAGHTEASVDLAVLAGLPPVGVLCEIVDEDGSMARLPKLRLFAEKNNLKIVSIADLIRYRRKRDRLIERASVARIPLRWGNVRAYCYRSVIDGIEHIAMVKGEIGDGQDILVRVHSECLTGDIFGSARCDCGDQLAMSMERIEKAGRGVLVYLRGHEGRGIGLGHKLRAYNLQDDGRDTVEANEELGLPVDSREYGIGAQILRDLGVRSMKLMTNNPAKYVGLKGYGLSIVGRVPLVTPITTENQRYLETKRTKMGHVYSN
ncbi:probable bifunctional riboflavin biosynthesis protein RIBA 2, chloroplastic isoform X2 [Triticum aestivum]|uniref:probable bifunctional riboflavin biosynthesis protein RIBA 2, chloroplastic isoform X2 n=1 Tax=Triticum aestivum TaxID=4565 RepID=UPI001D02CF17|nr:probable bifunctional riboflavin biosynthesis protein RIBA 2, chloroplastic isoform X2 [Triticum aestivum]